MKFKEGEYVIINSELRECIINIRDDTDLNSSFLYHPFKIKSFSIQNNHDLYKIIDSTGEWWYATIHQIKPYDALNELFKI